MAYTFVGVPTNMRLTIHMLGKEIQFNMIQAVCVGPNLNLTPGSLFWSYLSTTLEKRFLVNVGLSSYSTVQIE